MTGNLGRAIVENFFLNVFTNSSQKSYCILLTKFVSFTRVIYYDTQAFIHFKLISCNEV